MLRGGDSKRRRTVDGYRDYITGFGPASENVECGAIEADADITAKAEGFLGLEIETRDGTSNLQPGTAHTASSDNKRRRTVGRYNGYSEGQRVTREPTERPALDPASSSGAPGRGCERSVHVSPAAPAAHLGSPLDPAVLGGDGGSNSASAPACEPQAAQSCGGHVACVQPPLPRPLSPPLCGTACPLDTREVKRRRTRGKQPPRGGLQAGAPMGASRPAPSRQSKASYAT